MREEKVVTLLVDAFWRLVGVGFGRVAEDMAEAGCCHVVTFFLEVPYSS
jgi:hypothetical protein